MIVKMLFFAISFISLLDLSVSQFLQEGQCDPDILLVENFNFTEFSGNWNILRRTPNPIQNGECSTLQFAEVDGNLTVYNRAVSNNFLDEINGLASLQNDSAKFSISISGFNEPIDFWILRSTLYAANSMAYSCSNVNGTYRNVYLWQLSRATSVGDLIDANMNQTILSLLGITLESLSIVDHSESTCTTLPDIQPGEPVILPGQCNQNMSVVQNFNVTAFTGTWHEISSYATINEVGTCRRAQYDLSGSVVNVTNSEVVNQTLRVIAGTATVSSLDGSARLQVSLEILPGTFSDRPLWVLATDYTSYAVSYTCVDLPNNQRQVNSWILSRSAQLSSAAQVAVDAVIRSEIELNNRFYIPTNQSDEDCFFYPDFVPDEPVIFRGQCDETIPAIPNFSVSRYTGVWYNIESYHATSISGSCATARYTLINDYIEVNNSQVVNQELNSITGRAVINSTDGSGILLVTFPSTGNVPNTANYLVLDTDYDSYALVYSCVNINSEDKRVTSFKLGREKQLNSTSLDAIDRVISQIPVLDERYFVRQNHSEEGCFYYPEPQPGLPVVFPGQCEDNINVVSNFSLIQFAGPWNQIQAYPSQQQGQCVNHDLILVSNSSFTAVTSSVNDQFLDVFNSSLDLVSNDGSARMTLTVSSGQNTETIPFWILDTDYDNYALAYGCVNRDDGFRSVYAWKLSRTKELSSSNITSIANKMNDIIVLENRYFEDVDQSDRACFFLPEIPEGDPIILSGQCDLNIPVVPNFNATRYLGNWRLIESYPSDFQNGTCNRANYALGANNTVVVTNSLVNNQILNTAIASATIVGNGKLLVQFPDSNRPIEYWVLDTDYSSYALVYSCENINTIQRRVWSWKLSRTRDLTPTAIESINSVVNTIDVLNNRYFEVMDHSDDGCFYLPTPDPDTPVVFPGQCDPNIRVVTNFNAVLYMNLWHNIASYPTLFQRGTCNNAFYTLLPNSTVDVLNTEVINEALDTINGFATLATTDGSAKLNVNFPAPGGFVESPYWVLDTDYTSYALVYSCVNLDDERRQVWSWKLSRTKQLTAGAQAAITAVVNNIPVLNEQYYNMSNQTDDGCFYYPEPQPGVVVEFPGRCEDVQAIPNFNMTAFEGLWHEIEAYPKEQQSGQCINHNYILTSDRILSLESRNVRNQDLGVTNSLVTFASVQDTSGNLVITLNSGGQIITIPFIILSTDYDNYALAYSCINMPNDFRRVFSWKLSRNKILPDEANAAINNTIQNVTVLRNEYYEYIDQSDDACFYLPTPVPGEPVIFEGSCDENIPVVRNFDAANYLGRWLLIESYPEPSQKGSCNDATYSLNSDGRTVDVYNTEVLDQDLRTINGTAILASVDGSAKLEVTFPGNAVAAPYWVLDTDYTSFALVYSCRNIENNRRRVTSWKLSRTATLNETAISRINEVMRQINVLDDRYFELVNRTDDACFYLPTPGSESPIFRGLCDENISVVQNFNVSNYLGLWYDIESYPVRFQFGTCPSANYEASSSGVGVTNTEVVDQRLSLVEGSAVLASVDGSARLNVSFPIAGTNLTTSTPYWVLATDYDHFAVVYSCVNVGTDSRRVSSWKLSRTKSLLPASVTQISNVVNSVPVLNEMYYNTRGHTDEHCFYYPDNNGGPVVQNGQCDTNLNIVNNFDIDAFAGSWFEIARFPSEKHDGECVYNNFTANNQSFNMFRSIVTNDRLSNVFGSAIVSQDGRGIITVNLTNEAGATFETTYQVLDVEYNDFALLHNCRNLNNTHKQVYSWKLSRSQSGLSSAAVSRINQVVSNTTELFEDYYDAIDQSARGCFYYPEFDELPPAIVLRGPCNETIKAKSNFNTTAYLGKWYEIASYPQAFQDGKCARAHYSAGNNVVNVLNTQVVNRTLDIQTATAVVASNDGSGLLEVTFVLPNGVVNVVNYYVLETDYTSFALVYSCRNLGNGDRQVSSWKLSRQPVLLDDALPIIDEIVNNTQGLRQEYYNNRSQSDEDCFYVPEVNRNQAPVFRGQCENVIGIQGFNAQKYLGWWHEIESYPTDNDDGTCISSNFRADGNQFQVTDTNVFNTTAQVNTSSVTISNTGSIRRTLSNGNVVDIWVLATDYETYSLLYSCDNINSTHRRVWSAKHSKSRQLSPAAREAMAPFIDDNDTLEARLYIPIDQSDEACFHYPEQSGSQIILPGQCDPNITVVQNFEAAKYTGTWYQIEKYPQRFENGTCIGARYTLDENTGVVDVLNWQVVNGILDTIEGTATVNSTDGSAKLIVNLPIRGDNVTGMVSMDLYVLTTDYISYSLAYSCVNINQFERAVAAWKLSRTRTMPDQANSEINTYMSGRQELHQPYFESVVQNNDCEEPNSSHLLKSSIIIMLICSVLHFLY